FRRFLDNKLEDGERMWNLIHNGPYKSLMIPNLDNDQEAILEPLFKMTDVDARKKTKDMWERIKRLMFGSDVTSHVRHSRLMDEFDKFATKERESLESVYKRLTTLVNIMDHNNVRLIPVSINTKFLNCLQPEWSKYVTMELEGDSEEDKLTTAMKLLAREITLKFSTPTNNRLRTSSNTRNQVVVQDGRVDIQTKNAGYGGNGNRNAGRQNRIKRLMQEMEMMTVIRLFSVFHELSQLQEKENVQCYNCNEKGHYARNCQKLRVYDAKYFREQMLLAMKDEALMVTLRLCHHMITETMVGFYFRSGGILPTKPQNHHQVNQQRRPTPPKPCKLVVVYYSSPSFRDFTTPTAVEY
nr:hypothetical protein [Tanacetum cinerariifolium]